MLTAAGTVTLELLLDKPTLTGPVAAAESVTVHVAVPGAFTVVGEQEIPPSWMDGAKFMDVETLAPFQLALTVAAEPDENVPAVAVNVVEDCPAAIVTLAGTANDALLLLTEIAAAPEAALFSDTVQVAKAALERVDGVQAIEVNCAGAL